MKFCEDDALAIAWVNCSVPQGELDLFQNELLNAIFCVTQMLHPEVFAKQILKLLDNISQ